MSPDRKTLKVWLGYAGICYAVFLPLVVLAGKWSGAPSQILWDVWILSPLLFALAAATGMAVLLGAMFVYYNLRGAWNSYHYRRARANYCPTNSCCCGH